MASAISQAARSVKSKISWLDLRRSGLSVVERLVLEEALLRHDPMQRQWAIVGVHDPTYTRSTDLSASAKSNGLSQNGGRVFKKENCAIVLGAYVRCMYRR